jgi:hypothetical protein
MQSACLLSHEAKRSTTSAASRNAVLRASRCISYRFLTTAWSVAHQGARYSKLHKKVYIMQN